MKTYNIMELEEGKGYKDENGKEWWLDKKDCIIDEEFNDLTCFYTSEEIRKMEFTEIGGHITFGKALELMNSHIYVHSKALGLNVTMTPDKFSFVSDGGMTINALTASMINGVWTYAI